MSRVSRFGWLVLIAPLLMAAAAGPTVNESAVDKRLYRLTSELRCLVCANETLADSNADLAVNLRRQIRQMMRNGASDKQVVAYLTDRYGDYVLYRPPVKPSTWLLWFGPLLLLTIGAAVLVVLLRRQQGDHS
ncbi:MAG TPA: cytochrome c-type biogenesis protein [Gammaproteobacteria bacterium]|nr:cytochrome c-type biogenesis protein [Gammaproteobacteria bacterium]